MRAISKREKEQKKFPILLIFGLVLFFVATSIFSKYASAATAPAIITYQGKLLVSSRLATTTQSMYFILYDASSGGNILYTASGTIGAPLSVSTTPSQGLFSINLGDTGTNGLSQAIFQNNGSVFLEVRIGSDTLTPRKQITSVPYALNARYLDGVGVNTVSSTQYIPMSDSSGNFNFNSTTITTSTITNLNVLSKFGINSSSPIASLAVQGIGGTNPFTINSSTGSSLLSILQNGNVGINSSSPIDTLSVQGGFQVVGGITSTNFYVSGITNLGITTISSLTATNVTSTNVSSTNSYSNSYTGTWNGNLLSIAVGGTNSSTLAANGSIIYSDGISYNASAVGIIGQILQSNGAGTPVWINTTTMGFVNLQGATSGTLQTGNFNISGTGLVGTAFGVNTTSPIATFALQGIAGTNPFEVASSTGASLFRILQNGYVGIGTSTPTAMLEVIGTGGIAQQDSPGLVARSVIVSGKFYPNINGLAYGLDSNTLTIGYSGSANIITAGGKLTIQPAAQSGQTQNIILNPTAGNVGIGTSTPTEKLSVVGNISNIMDASTTISQVGTVSVSAVGAPFSVFVSGRYAYTANWTGNNISVIDVSNPSTPVLISTTSITASKNGAIFVSGRYAYVGNSMLNSLSVVDVSNPAAPRQVATTSVGAGSTYSIFVSGHYLYAATDGPSAISVIDISNPLAPVLISTTSVDTYPRSIYVSGGYAYTANYNSSTISVIDISNPSAPRQISTTSVGMQPKSIYVSGRYAYTADYTSNTISVIDISNASAPIVVATTSVGSGPSAIYVSGRYAYVGNKDSSNISIVDVSSSSAPIQVLTLAVSAQPETIYVSGRYAYVGATNLSIVDISGTEVTSLIAHSAEVGNIQSRNDIFAQGNIMAGTGLMVGNGGIMSQGALSVFASSTGATSSIFDISSAQMPSIFKVFANGRIGVGTSTPLAKLFVQGAGTENPFSIVSSSAAASSMFTVLTNGNVGINSSSPIDTLAVQGGFQVVGGVTSTNLYVSSLANIVKLGVNTSSPIATFAVQGTGDTNPFEIASSTGTSLFRILQNGNVGINSSSPSSAFAVSGTTTIDGRIYFAPGTALLPGIAFIDDPDTGLWRDAANTFGAMVGGAYSVRFLSGGFSTGAGGSATSPSITLGGDSNTGIWAPAADQLAITTNGVNRFTVSTTAFVINPSGTAGFNIGYNTTSPIATFALQGIGGTDPFEIASSTGASLFRILQNGNVGIGTSTPTEKLSVVGNISNIMDSNTVISQIATTSVEKNPVGIFVSGRYAYVTNYTSNTISVVDVSNPSNPVQIATTSVGTNPSSVYVSGRYAYVTNQGSHTISVVDVSTPAFPIQIATTSVGFGPTSIYITGRYAYVGNSISGNISVVDISNPSAPVQIATANVGPAAGRVDGIAVSGRYAYVVDNSNLVMDVFDISNPAVPREITTVGIDGGAFSIYVSGRYAYTANWSSDNISIVDISNPSAPIKVGTASVGAQPRSIFVSGRYAYVGNYSGGTISVVDISSSTAPSQITTVIVGTNPRGIFVSGRYAYVANYGSASISIVDISGTEVTSLIAHSAEVGNLQSRNDIFAQGNIIAGTGLMVGAGGIMSNGSLSVFASSTGATSSIFNISSAQLSSVFKVFANGAVSIGTSTASSTLTIQGIASSNAVLNIVSSSGASLLKILANGNIGIGTSTPTEKLSVVGNISNILDRSNINTISQVATVAVGKDPNSVFVSGRYAYVANISSNTISVIDVSNPVVPVQISTTSVNAQPRSIYVSGRYAYVAVGSPSSIAIIDISNPKTPTQISTSSIGDTNPYSIYVSGRYAYVAHSVDGGTISVVDIANPKSPFFVASTSMGVGTYPQSIYVSGRYAYVANNGNSSISVIDISNPSTHVEIGTVTLDELPNSISVSGRYAYVGHEGGLFSVVDISNPSSPTQATTTNIGNGTSFSIFVSGRYVYMANYTDNSVSIIDVSSSTYPVQVAKTAVGSGPASVFVSGRYAYVVNQTGKTLSIVDISGTEVTSLIAHSAEVGNLQSRNDIFAQGNIMAGTSLMVGAGGIMSQGSLSVFASSTGSTSSIFNISSAQTPNILKVFANGISQFGGNIMPSSSPTAGASTRVTTTVDSANNVGSSTSMVIGADGFPVISYYDVTNGNLMVAKCGNAACSSGNVTTTVDSAGDRGQFTSIVIGVDGFPVISYYNVTNGDLLVAKCGNASCSSGNTTTTVDSAGTVGLYTSIAIGTDGLPIISYQDGKDGSSSDLRITKCGNTSCSSGNTMSVVDSAGTIGSWTSLAIGTDGRPVIAYQDTAGGGLRIAKCGNAACSSGNTTTTVLAGGALGIFASLAIGTDGLPVISWQNDDVDGNLRVTKCGNTSCTSGNTSTLIDVLTTDLGYYSSLAIGTDGLPVISYYNEASDDLMVAKCGNASCTSGNTTSTIDGAGSRGLWTSIAIGTDGLPVISYYNLTDGDLLVAHCANPSCSATSSGSFTGGFNIGSTGAFFSNVYANSFWGKQFQIEGFDVAESYRVDDFSIMAGDLVRIASSSSGIRPTVEKTSGVNDSAIGVISTNPGIRLTDWTSSDDGRLVSLSGRVPTKVSTENGSISPGDPITASSLPGIGMKAVKDGAVVGRALESYSGEGIGLIEVFINPSWSAQQSALTVNTASSTLTVGSSLSPYDLIVTGNISMSNASMVNKLTFATSTLFESNVSNFTGANTFIFNAPNFSDTSPDNYLISLRSNNTPVFSVSANGDVHSKGNYYGASAVLGTSTNPGDLAERVDIAMDDTVEAGDVMVIDQNAPDSYRRSGSAYEQSVAGIISSNPTIIVGNGKTDYTAVMAMVGRVPVKVSNENGNIQRGDLLISASTAGYAMKYDPTKDNKNKMVAVIGVALESSVVSTSKVLALIRTGWIYNRDQAINNLQNNIEQIAAAQGINLSSSSDPGRLNSQYPISNNQYIPNGNLDLNFNSLINVSSIIGKDNKWRIDEDGNLIQKIATAIGDKETYGLQSSGKQEIVISGTSTLENGLRKVILTDLDQAIIDKTVPLKIMITPAGETKGVYVSERNYDSFVAKENENGTSNAEFDWTVIAKILAPDAEAYVPDTMQSNPQNGEQSTPTAPDNTSGVSTTIYDTTLSTNTSTPIVDITVSSTIDINSNTLATP